jgi:2-phosphosulfolactate phosphatase
MRIDVALTPALIRDAGSAVCIVVDVLRASTACVTMFDRGVDRIAVAPDPEAARQLRDLRLPEALLCGEVGGLPPEGFDYGNSPLEFSRLDLRGRRAILATSNGTRALHAVAGAPVALVGCLRNRAAVVAAAYAAASTAPAGTIIVCAGNDYGATFSVDDTVAAGAIVASLLDRCLRESADAQPSDAALAALRLYQAYPDAEQAFRESMHGRTLQRLGFAEDLSFSAAADASSSVPALERERSGVLALRRWEPDR